MVTPRQTGRVAVTVCYLTPAQAIVRPVRLPNGASVLRAVHASGILGMCGDIDLDRQKIGVHGRIVKLDDKLCDGGRVEIYRPVTAKGKRILKKKDK